LSSFPLGRFGPGRGRLEVNFQEWNWPSRFSCRQHCRCNLSVKLPLAEPVREFRFFCVYAGAQGSAVSSNPNDPRISQPTIHCILHILPHGWPIQVKPTGVANLYPSSGQLWLECARKEKAKIGVPGRCMDLITISFSGSPQTQKLMA